MDPAILNPYLQVIAHIVTILGLPWAIIILYKEKKKERLDREHGTYDALDDKYIHFLELCLERPEVDLFDVPININNPEDKNTRDGKILFLILISILERAYIMYSDQSSSIKRKQWSGWVEYIDDYCKRKNFRELWEELSDQFEAEFVSFINLRVQQQAIED